MLPGLLPEAPSLASRWEGFLGEASKEPYPTGHLGHLSDLFTVPD